MFDEVGHGLGITMRSPKNHCGVSFVGEREKKASMDNEGRTRNGAGFNRDLAMKVTKKRENRQLE